MANNSKDKSMFMYTALIFVAAIIIILIAFFSQTNLQKANEQAVASIAATTAPSPPDELQGIDKSTAELSQKNMELLEENKDLYKQITELTEKNEATEKLMSAFSYLTSNQPSRASAILTEADYESLTADGKLLYDYIKAQSAAATASPAAQG